MDSSLSRVRGPGLNRLQVGLGLVHVETVDGCARSELRAWLSTGWVCAVGIGTRLSFVEGRTFTLVSSLLLLVDPAEQFLFGVVFDSDSLRGSLGHFFAFLSLTN